MAKIKHKLIFDPIFRSETMFYACKNGEDAVAHARKTYDCKINTYGFKTVRGTCMELICQDTGIASWMVWIGGSRDWKAMTHEAAHLVFRILDVRGVKYDSNNDETWCYMQEYFVNKFWQIMCKK